MNDDYKILTVHTKPYLVYDKLEGKHKIAITETIFKYYEDGKEIKECYDNEIILDDNPDEKAVFRLKLKGDTAQVHRPPFLKS